MEEIEITFTSNKLDVQEDLDANIVLPCGLPFDSDSFLTMSVPCQTPFEVDKIPSLFSTSVTKLRKQRAFMTEHYLGVMCAHVRETVK